VKGLGWATDFQGRRRQDVVVGAYMDVFTASLEISCPAKPVHAHGQIACVEKCELGFAEHPHASARKPVVQREAFGIEINPKDTETGAAPGEGAISKTPQQLANR
jgi:hypothetical protein